MMKMVTVKGFKLEYEVSKEGYVWLRKDEESRTLRGWAYKYSDKLGCSTTLCVGKNATHRDVYRALNNEKSWINWN